MGEDVLKKKHALWLLFSILFSTNYSAATVAKVSQLSS